MENSKNYYAKSEVVDNFDLRRFESNRGRYAHKLQWDLINELLEDIQGPILEVGTGTGRFTIELKKKNFNLISLDPSLNMLLYNKSKLQQEGLKSVLVNGDGFYLPFKSDTFDAVFCINVFSHIPDPKPMIDEFIRVARPSGYIIFNYPNLLSPFGFLVGRIINPIRKIFGLMEVFSIYHRPSIILNHLKTKKVSIVRNTGLFFIDSRIFPRNMPGKLFEILEKYEKKITMKKNTYLLQQNVLIIKKLGDDTS